MAVQIQIRRDTAATWTSQNPTLANGELGYETDTGSLKIGNGSSNWSSLSYFSSGGGSSVASRTVGVQSGNSRWYDPTMGARVFSSGTAITVNGFLIALPIHFSNSVSLDAIGAEVTTAGAGSTTRFGMYNDNSGIPGDLVFDAGTVSTASTGGVSIAISQTLSAGMYWICMQVATSNVTFRGWTSTGGGHGDLGFTNLTDTIPAKSVYVSNTGAFPSSWPGGETYFNGATPTIKVREG